MKIKCVYCYGTGLVEKQRHVPIAREQRVQEDKLFLSDLPQTEWYTESCVYCEGSGYCEKLGLDLRYK